MTVLEDLFQAVSQLCPCGESVTSTLFMVSSDYSVPAWREGSSHRHVSAPNSQGDRGQPGGDLLSAAALGREGTLLLLQPRAPARLSLGDRDWPPVVFPKYHP